eukprot:4838053-Karenia_brevis.AAC.1
MLDPLQGPAASSSWTQDDPYTDAVPMDGEASPGIERSKAASRRPSKPSRASSKRSIDGAHTQTPLVEHLKQTGQSPA